MLRRQIKRTILSWRLAHADELRIVVGASGHAPPGWVATDITSLDLLREADWRSRFAEGSVAAILAEHVWEHLGPADGLEAARRCRRYLRPGGHLRIAVPDGLHPDPTYREAVRPGGTGPGADDHKILYTYCSLGGLLEQAGFTLRLLEYFNESGQFHAADWEPDDGMVRRSHRFDPRNAGGQHAYTSLIIDAIRP
ncbi:methyltransferase domain-containing protein [Chloroflexales bacterium ZM16-3]|nr:methyltransferase domain-containing protein [Chloroflexales bacterium ZM16-3]